MATMAVSSFDLPGDSGFPLNSFMSKPANRGESGMLRTHAHANFCGESKCIVSIVDQMRQYFTQLRQETGLRLTEKVFGDENKPSKVN